MVLKLNSKTFSAQDRVLEAERMVAILSRQTQRPSIIQLIVKAYHSTIMLLSQLSPITSFRHLFR